MNLNIFIADDSPMVCARLMTILCEIDGVSIVGYSLDLRQAISGIAAARPEIVLIGSQHPRNTIAVLLRFMREECPDSAAIVLTDQPFGEPGRYREAGACLEFDKAAGLDRLVETIRAMTGRPEPDRTPL